ncbi:Trk system potassium transporter TrkA [Mucisphaera calidilacus]|uniref:Trk system potassium uptake protein TrkA n=1 Tax=Mucisphaera calidilacus TaxID=2527982 RepID=A0A518BZ05_9BACT|nr:Trk system potassium transporter TrkA [Mucisphaera calidilacus]QDU72207.1 Trk system potassium uptake protein TrkA [Mucisphaera calidilacus]
MNIVICGAGEVGRYAAEVLTGRKHNVTLIDKSAEVLDELEDRLDTRMMVGTGTQADVQAQAGVATADLFIAATNIDEINLLAASIAKAVGARKTIARVHHSVYFEKRGLDYSRHLGIDHLVCPEHATAQAIASVVRAPGAMAVERFAHGEIEMQSLGVREDARAAGTMLRELKLPGAARLVSIEREGKAFVPTGDSTILAGDVVTIIGETGGMTPTRKLFDTSAGQRRSIIIMGGSSQAVWVCRELRNRRFSVRLFEPDRERAEELAEKLDWITVLNDDPIRSEALTEERVDLADAFVALTDDDENNILAAAQAKSLGAKTAIAVQQRATYLHLLRHVGIDRAFSPRANAVDELLRLIDTTPMRPIAQLAGDAASVFEIQIVNRATEVIGRPLSELTLPPSSLIVAVQRGDHVFVPGAQDVLEGGDTAVLVTPDEHEREIRKLFQV